MLFLLLQFVQIHFLFLEMGNPILKCECFPPDGIIQNRLAMDPSTPSSPDHYRLHPHSQHLSQTYMAHQWTPHFNLPHEGK